MKRAYLVIGPESSGTRMMTKILIAAGCNGSNKLSQPFDYKLPEDEDPIVWRRSGPHGGRWPRLVHMASELFKRDYLVQFIITNREWYPMVCSQVKNNHVNSMSDGYKNVLEFNHRVMDAIEVCQMRGYLHEKFPYVMAYYESLAFETENVLKYLMPMLDLKIPDIKIYNGNTKWYGSDNKLQESSSVKGAAIVNPSVNIQIEGTN